MRKSDEEILFEEKNIVYDSVSKAVENIFFFRKKEDALSLKEISIETKIKMHTFFMDKQWHFFPLLVILTLVNLDLDFAFFKKPS